MFLCRVGPMVGRRFTRVSRHSQEYRVSSFVQPGNGYPHSIAPPLYPFMIAAFWWTTAYPITAVVLVQTICGAATVVLVCLIAKDRFSEKLRGLLWRKVL